MNPTNNAHAEAFRQLMARRMMPLQPPPALTTPGLYTFSSSSYLEGARHNNQFVPPMAITTNIASSSSGSSSKTRGEGDSYAGDKTDNNLTFMIAERVPEADLFSYFRSFGPVHRAEYIAGGDGGGQSRCFIGFCDSRDMASALAALRPGRTSTLLGRPVSYLYPSRGSRLTQQPCRGGTAPGAVTPAHAAARQSAAPTPTPPLLLGAPTPTPARGGSVYYCESCDKHLPSKSALDAHMKAHERCSEPACAFSGSKRAVAAHFHSAHGQFHGSGFKDVSVDGRQFRVLLGTSPEEVEQWRAERRRRFPTSDAARDQAERVAALAAAGGVLQDSGGSLKKRPRQEADGAGGGKDGKRQCFQFARGRCSKAQCRFSHGEAEAPRRGSSKLHLPAPLAGGSRGTLLRALLQDQERREENLLLQSLRYIACHLFPSDE